MKGPLLSYGSMNSNRRIYVVVLHCFLIHLVSELT